MRCNETTAVSLKDRILLVPYETTHVTTYHEWMKDPAIQQQTASEPLTLAEEHAMQQSWRASHDKLTFIICLALDSSNSPSNITSSSSSSSDIPVVIKGGIDDNPARMIGDVNLFIYDNDADEEKVIVGKERKERKSFVGELELMIAPTSHRRQGHGRSALLAFLHYIIIHLPSILSTYSKGSDPGNEDIEQSLKHIQFKVKIGSDNTASLRLFESLGFIKIHEKANYFGEFELDLADSVVDGWSQGILGDVEGGEKSLGERYLEGTYIPVTS